MGVFPSRNRPLTRDPFASVRIGGPRGWSDTYYRLLKISWPIFLCVLLATYLAINVVFGFAYFACGFNGLEGWRSAGAGGRLLECFFFSVQTLGTIGYGRISPVSLAANLLVTLESFVGILEIAIATGMVFVRFARPTARVIFSHVAVLTDHDGVPSLVFRMANERSNRIMDADLSLHILRTEFTAEGEEYRNFHELALERSHTPVFAASWTAVHPITPQSPLHGKSIDDLRREDAQLIVALTGVDDTFSQAIHTRFAYGPDQLLEGRKFQDILSWDKQGTLVVDLSRIHEVV